MLAKFLLPLILFLAVCQPASAGMITRPSDTPEVTGSMSVPVTESPDEQDVVRGSDSTAGMTVTSSSISHGVQAACSASAVQPLSLVVASRLAVSNASLPASPLMDSLLKPS